MIELSSQVKYRKPVINLKALSRAKQRTLLFAKKRLEKVAKAGTGKLGAGLDFLHGFEFIESTTFQGIQTIDASIIGLVGTAPQGPVNTPYLVLNGDDTTFGPSTPGFTIPDALNAIFAQGDGVGMVIVVNVYDGSISSPPSPSDIGDSDIVGGVDGNGNKTGIKALLDASSLYGVAPKILIAPGYSSSKTVADALLAVASSLRARVIADSQLGWKDTDIIGYAGEFDNHRMILAYPQVRYENLVSETEEIMPASPWVAGVMSRTINTKGFNWSTSNQVILGITGLERPIPYITFHSQDSEANYLNSQNITTIINAQGFRVWGDRSVSTVSPWLFYAIRQQFDTIEDSIEQGNLSMLDRPINKIFFTLFKGDVQAYLNGLVGAGIINYGKADFTATDNPSEQVIQGHVTMRLTITPTPPAERITELTVLDIAPLAQLFS